jgi:NAD(P)H dehydrogenase (quinone)
MYQWGAIVVAPGYTDPSIFTAGGNPYGTSVTVDNDGNIKEDAMDAVRHQTKRVVTVADWIKKGQGQV